MILSSSTSPNLLSKIGLTTLTFFAGAPALFAQKTNALDKYVLSGGPTMLLILVAILALIALTVFNFMNLGKSKFCPQDFKEEVMDHMVNCRVRSAIEASAEHPSYLGRMLAYALPNVDATRPQDLGRESVEDAIADFAINENRRSMVWINYVSLVAQAAPMLGLFGTVLGMVEAFATLAGTGGADPSQLAGNISTALLTTLWGLITAIPALGLFFFFKNKLQSNVAECQEAAEEMINASLETINQEAMYAKIPEGLA